MKILNSSQIREADRQTIACEPIASIELMERAAIACRDWIIERFPPAQTFSIICGSGNNGGDGLALYRLLTEKKYPCQLYVFPLEKQPRPDYSENLLKIDPKQVCQLTPKTLSSISDKDIIIDALLGSGLNRPVAGPLKKIITILNGLHNKVISIDLPSGLFCEYNANNPAEGIVQADHTLTFQNPKLAFLLPERGEKAGTFDVLDIGLLPSFMEKISTSNYYLTADEACSYYRHPQKFDHKGSNGHLLLIAGSRGKMGAAVLAAKAAMRSGLGKLSVLSPLCGIDILQNSVPEAMVEVNNGNYSISGYYELKYPTIALGPGLGTAPETMSFLKALLSENPSQMVIDADAINLLAAQPDLIKKLPQNSILTPHPKEFERLVGPWKDDQEKLERLRGFVIENQLICVLKGAHSAIALPNGNIWFNSSGHPGMATAGSGDVLTGIIGGLLAKGHAPMAATLLGVYSHGRSAELLASALSVPFMLASDLISGLNAVWKEMESST